MIRYKQNQKGFSLVETLVALTVLLISLAAPLTIAAKSLQNIFYAREQYTAIMLAQEGLEAIFYLQRSDMIDAVKTGGDAWDWYTGGSFSDCRHANGCGVDFSGSASNPVVIKSGNCGAGGSACNLYFDPTNSRARYSHNSSDPISPYTRVVRVIDIGSGTYEQVTVESEVTWTSVVFPSNTNESVIVRTNLFNVASTNI